MPSYKPVVVLSNGKMGLLPDGATLLAKVQEVDAIELQAKEAITAAGMVVYSSANFQVLLAKADDDTKAEAFGLATTTADLDGYVTVLTDGVLELADWTGVTGAAALTNSTYWLDTTAGKLTSVVPTTGNLVKIGKGIAPTKLEISIEAPVKLS